jgi:kojibiose phosphorylase
MELWMERKNSYYVALLQQMTPDAVLPGALDFLREVRQAGMVIGIASASKNASTVLSRLGLWGYVDVVSNGYSVERPKPAPDLFLACARRLDVQPAEAVVVEDAAAGVEAALKGGFWVVGLGPRERVVGAHAIFPGLEGVRLNDVLEAIARAARQEARLDTNVSSSGEFLQ